MKPAPWALDPATWDDDSQDSIPTEQYGGWDEVPVDITDPVHTRPWSPPTVVARRAVVDQLDRPWATHDAWIALAALAVTVCTFGGFAVFLLLVLS